MQRHRGTVLLAAVLLVIQLVCWRGTVRLKATFPRRQQTLLTKRSWEGEMSKSDFHNTTTATTSATTTTPSITSDPPNSEPSSPTTTPCQPLPFPNSPQDLCNHIRVHCPPAGHLDYLRFYYCIGLNDVLPTLESTQRHVTLDDSTSELKVFKKKGPKIAPVGVHLTTLRIFALICIILWMLFLFSWVGVVASDFFCPNLGTIAARLGLSESTAGVTFLAFGNGSPDVFSTFGAMRTGSGSLAIGELIGAASYIVSVISGSMMLIAPFRVKPYPFLRDVGFFTVAVAMMMAFLFDGKLRFNECIGMIGLYLAYATTVIVGSWWQERRRRQRLLMSNVREEYSNTRTLIDEDSQPAPDMERRSSLLGLPPSPSHLQVSPIEYDPDVDPFSVWQQPSSSSRGPSPHHSPLLTGYDLPPTSSTMSNVNLQRFRPLAGARHSLLGAVEFRDVVRSLQQEALADRSVEIYQSRDPERFFPHNHHHPHHVATPAPAGAGAGAAQEANRQKAQRSSSQRSHTRGRSLMTFKDVVTPKFARSNSVSGNADNKPSMYRSHTTIGTSAGGSRAGAVEADATWSLTRRTQPSAFDATAVEAAVGDPWREHSASDGCEQNLPSGLGTSVEGGEGGQEEQRNNRAGERPHLRLKTSIRANSKFDSIEEERASSGREQERSKKQSFPVLIDVKGTLVPTFQILFPSLRHVHEKSWLGIAVGIITAPAILILNLTLPVVDDEAESAAVSGEMVATVNDVGRYSKGNIRLEGEENDIYATMQGQTNSSDNDLDDNIITLDPASPVQQNPWNAASDRSREGENNRRNHLKVASALRRLPRDASPLLGDSNPSFKVSQHDDADSNVESDDDNHDADSFDSQDSHLNNSQASHLFFVFAQCIFAPPFCVWSISSSAESSHVGFKTAIALLAGLGLAIVALLALAQFRRKYQDEVSSPLSVYLAVGWTRVAAGFLVSILYIMTIVDEVVSILQTLGIILGLSDAILGLTVFAMGNSLGDLVANVTIARMGHPVMAISACFAGPLLNLLLGIGISGTYLLSGNRLESIPNQPNPHSQSSTSIMRGEHAYFIDFSPTLTVSGVGLLIILIGTLVAVPLNGFYLNRSIGLTLIITYAVIMTTNVLVEIYYLDRG